MEKKAYTASFTSSQKTKTHTPCAKNIHITLCQEKQPEDIKTLDQLKNYIVSISNKYPTAFCAITYSQFKTEDKLQGRAGAGVRIGTIGWQKHKGITRDSGAKEKNIDLDGILLKYRQISIDMGAAAYEFGYKKNEDESFDAIRPDCFLKSACLMAHDEGLLKRPAGGMNCAHSNVLCQFLKVHTGSEWDYDLLEFDKPHCISRFFII